MKNIIRNIFSRYVNADPKSVRALVICALIFCGAVGLLSEDANCYICFGVNASGILLGWVESLGFSSNKKLQYLIDYKYRWYLNFIGVFFGCAVFITECFNINTRADRFFIASFIIILMGNSIIHYTINKLKRKVVKSEFNRANNKVA